MVQLACMPENRGDMHVNLMMGSGRLPEGRSDGVDTRMEAGEPLEGRLVSNNEVSMSHGHLGQDSDCLACTGLEHMMWRKSTCLESSSMELGCFSKPDDSA